MKNILLMIGGTLGFLSMAFSNCGNTPLPVEYHAVPTALHFHADTLSDAECQIQDLEAQLEHMAGAVRQFEARVDKTEDRVDRARLRELTRMPVEIISGRPPSSYTRLQAKGN